MITESSKNAVATAAATGASKVGLVAGTDSAGGLVAVTADQFGCGGLHPDGRQTPCEQGEIVQHQFTDLGEGGRDPARPVGRQHESVQVA